jgi:adenylate cyclase, class 2
MARETEIKLRIEDVPGFRRALKRLGARRVNGKNGCVHEWNVVYDTPGDNLKQRGQLLRVRTERLARSGAKSERSRWERVTLTFKCPVDGQLAKQGRAGEGEHKVRDEIEVQVTDGKALTRILEGLGLRAWFRYEKFRTTFRLPEKQRWASGLLIELDEAPIGTFVELEGPPRAIDRAAEALGYTSRDYITSNYFELYREQCRRNRAKLGDMLFVTEK